MAIMKDIEIPAGTNLSVFFDKLGFEYVTKDIPYPANNIYIKIDVATAGTDKMCTLRVSFKKDEKGDTLFTKDYTFSLNLDSSSDNVFKQGYDHLKSLDEFKGAIDV